MTPWRLLHTQPHLLQALPSPEGPSASRAAAKTVRAHDEPETVQKRAGVGSGAPPPMTARVELSVPLAASALDSTVGSFLWVVEGAAEAQGGLRRRGVGQGAPSRLRPPPPDAP
eukprot:CAMPEP_0119380690 /NCGR_PEP_ID=MMETSP1334-20130426/57872_1 /TAXON_ID=127549 /ORGANISM="Calcidiscus leptoporus, Strain RCC1130" /LENGTH=113 /DNA_ID=CAMNT_0007400617 /DNA_START=369 /DNA_END=707 /DNA_ORIENTATION=-